MVELKKVITTWVNDGKAYDGKIDFYDHDRYAEVSLPRTANKAATVAFKNNK
jgi:L-rhamnose isomerase